MSAAGGIRLGVLDKQALQAGEGVVASLVGVLNGLGDGGSGGCL